MANYEKIEKLAALLVEEIESTNVPTSFKMLGKTIEQVIVTGQAKRGGGRRPKGRQLPKSKIAERYGVNPKEAKKAKPQTLADKVEAARAANAQNEGVSNEEPLGEDVVFDVVSDVTEEQGEQIELVDEDNAVLATGVVNKERPVKGKQGSRSTKKTTPKKTVQKKGLND